jgi:hypothetical protein
MIRVLEVATRAAMDVEGVDVDVEVGTEGERVADFKALQKRKIILLMKLQSSRYVGVDHVNLPTNLTLNAIDPTNSPGRDLGNFHNIM